MGGRERQDTYDDMNWNWKKYKSQSFKVKRLAVSFSNFSMHQNHLEGRPLCPSLWVSDFLGLERSSMISILNKLPGDTDTAGLGATFGEPLI